MEHEVGKKIKKLRTERRWTLEQLADEVGVTKSTVKKWEAGTIDDIGFTKIVRLAEIFGTSVDYFAKDTARSTIVNNSSISYSAIGNCSRNHIEVGTESQPDMELIALIHSLPLRERTKVLSYAYELSDKTKTPVLSGTSVE